VNQITKSSKTAPTKVFTKAESEMEADAIDYLEKLEAKLNYKKTGYRPRQYHANRSR